MMEGDEFTYEVDIQGSNCIKTFLVLILAGLFPFKAIYNVDLLEVFFNLG